MELTHKLTYNSTTTVIDEPIGFDDLQMTLKRNDYHGMGAEVSLGNLEFYGSAYNIIKTAYETNIDAEVQYLIVDENNSMIYSGKLDLTTCSFLKGDYQSVKAKVGDIGAMTTFNNRLQTDVDLTESKTVDGTAMDDPDWCNLHIPMKHLLYTNLLKQRVDRAYTKVTTEGGEEAGDLCLRANTGYQEIDLRISSVNANEFGDLNTGIIYVPTEQFANHIVYSASSDLNDKFGSDLTMHVDVNFKLKIQFLEDPFAGVSLENKRLDIHAGLMYGNVRSKQHIATSERLFIDAGDLTEHDLSFSGEADISAINNLYIGIWMSNYCHDSSFNYKNAAAKLKLTVEADTYLKMTMYDTLQEDQVNADMLLVRDALNVVAQAISEKALSIKSNWYEYSSSSGVGGGALKAITNGYHIRGLFTDGDTKRNMPLSFKSLIESLNAMDCIGWGFSKESGTLFVRVERWDWFYNDTVVLTLTNVAEVTTEVYPDSIPTELQIGYKKYATQDQYNSIDSPHGTRTFTSGIKALSKAHTKESEFIADNYAIEEIRRARNDVSETEETTYDESIFIFELSAFKPTSSSSLYGLGITHSATNAQNVGRASEFINAKLTPRHMAARWRSFLFATNNTTPFRFTSGEINYKASFGVQPSSVPGQGGATYYLQSYEETSPQVENADISYVHAKFKAEKITFQCPITTAQYQAVKANPYGLISVNGVQGWILDFKYSLYDGLADFTLIAKYTS